MDELLMTPHIGSSNIRGLLPRRTLEPLLEEDSDTCTSSSSTTTEKTSSKQVPITALPNATHVIGQICPRLPTLQILILFVSVGRAAELEMLLTLVRLLRSAQARQVQNNNQVRLKRPTRRPQRYKGRTAIGTSSRPKTTVPTFSICSSQIQSC